MKYSEEQIEHYNFYVDNCTDGEIPISLELWVLEYWADVMDKLTAAGWHRYHSDYDKKFYDVKIGGKIYCQVWPNAGQWRDHEGNLLYGKDLKPTMYIRDSFVHPMDCYIYEAMSPYKYDAILQNPAPYIEEYQKQDAIHSKIRAARELSENIRYEDISLGAAYVRYLKAMPVEHAAVFGLQEWRRLYWDIPKTHGKRVEYVMYDEFGEEDSYVAQYHAEQIPNPPKEFTASDKAKRKAKKQTAKSARKRNKRRK